MDLRLDIERRKRFAGKERDYKREGGRSPGGSRGPSRERSSEKTGKHHKKSKYVQPFVLASPLEMSSAQCCGGGLHAVSRPELTVSVDSHVAVKCNINYTDTPPLCLCSQEG